MSYYFLQDGFETLMDNGFLAVLVFMLIFGIVYGVLQSVGLFVSGKKGTGDYSKNLKKLRKIHAIIALVLAMLSVLPHYYSRYGQYDIIPVLTEILPQISIGIMLILVSLILLGVFGIKFKASDKNPMMMFIFFAIVGLVIWMVGDSAYWWDLPYWLNYDLVAGIIAILVFVGVMKFIMGDDEKEKKQDKIIEAIKAGNWKKVPASYMFKDLVHNYKNSGD